MRAANALVSLHISAGSPELDNTTRTNIKCAEILIYVGWSFLDTSLVLKTKRTIRDLSTELEYRLKVAPSDILGKV